MAYLRAKKGEMKRRRRSAARVSCFGPSPSAAFWREISGCHVTKGSAAVPFASPRVFKVWGLFGPVLGRLGGVS